tara:strand:- start:3905 stop:4519 length:615 start_codon:yes stop_codon:yes gene_type:complete
MQVKAHICMPQDETYYIECKSGICDKGFYKGRPSCMSDGLKVLPLSQMQLKKYTDILKDRVEKLDGLYEINVTFILFGASKGPSYSVSNPKFKTFEEAKEHWEDVVFKEWMWGLYNVLSSIAIMLFLIAFVLSIPFFLAFLIRYISKKNVAHESDLKKEEKIEREKIDLKALLITIIVNLPITIIIAFFSFLILSFLIFQRPYY